MRMLLNWILSALALWIAAQIVPGVHVANYGWALIAVIVIGFINATLGLFLKFITFPLTVFTLGIFWWVINALMLWLASTIVPGFAIERFWQAFVAAILLSLMNLIARKLTRRISEPERDSY
jgi:putative membrane protein